MTRLIHAPGERRLDCYPAFDGTRGRETGPVYALLDDAGFVALVAGEEVKPRTSDGNITIVLRLSDIGFERMAQIVYQEMCRRGQDKERLDQSDAATPGPES